MVFVSDSEKNLLNDPHIPADNGPAPKRLTTNENIDAINEKPNAVAAIVGLKKLPLVLTRLFEIDEMALGNAAILVISEKTMQTRIAHPQCPFNA